MARLAVVFAIVALLGCSAPAVRADSFRDALMSLYTATNGASWTNNAGWGSSANYCTWYGVQCPLHTTGDITGVVLSNNNLNGPVPAAFSMIRTMKTLDLSHNSISGNIPPVFGNMPALVTLDLSFNQLSGSIPANMVNFTFNWPTLKTINLNNNKLSGEIPDALFGPATLPPFYPALNLQVFNVEYNQLTGALPARVLRGASLYTFMLGYNQLTSIPAVLDDWLSGIKYCSLGGNKWACPIPKSVSNNCQAYCQ